MLGDGVDGGILGDGGILYLRESEIKIIYLDISRL